MAKEKKDDPLSLESHVINHYGYEVLADGSIKLAPGLCEGMDKLMIAEAGLKALLAATNEYAAKEFSRIRKDQQNWWRRVKSETTISLDEPWAYNTDEHKIEKHERVERPPEFG